MSKFGFLNKNFNVPKEEAKSEAPKSAKEIKEEVFDHILNTMIEHLPSEKKAAYNAMFDMLDQMRHADMMVFMLAMKAYQNKITAEIKNERN
jgi:hypothetical protein